MKKLAWLCLFMFSNLALAQTEVGEVLVAQNTRAQQTKKLPPKKASKTAQKATVKKSAKAAKKVISAPKDLPLRRPKPSPTVRSAPVAQPMMPRSSSDDRMAQARSLAASGRYEEASRLLFQLSRSPGYVSDAAQIKYILGMMLYDMKLYQSSAFIFYDVIRQESARGSGSKYLRQSFEKLSMAADSLESDVLLKYAIKKVDENEFPAGNRDMLYFRMGELRMADRAYMDAVRFFSRVGERSYFYEKSRYKMALALAEANELDKSINVFDELAQATSNRGITDRTRVNAILGKARVLYQMKKWDESIDAYREIPRDTEQWHDALFESSWAMLRSARFRSALSNFHSLHSPYYEYYYQPESILLRAIVYLYICRYDELNKTLDLFERIYKPVQKDLRSMLMNTRDSLSYYRELRKVLDSYTALKAGRMSDRQFQIPFLVAVYVLKEADIRRSLNYLNKLQDEKKRIQGMSSSWTSSGIGKYAQKIVETRIVATQKLIGKQVRRHMIAMQSDLRDHFEQNGFLRFEMISGQKEALKKEMTGKRLPKETVDEGAARDFYIQNGYEYWPFKGEYWLDEIGNYHYVGVQACE